jgi:hypothetical protein
MLSTNADTQGTPNKKRWVTVADIHLTRQHIRQQAIKRIPSAIVKGLSTGVAILAGLTCIAWIVLEPKDYPGGLLSYSTTMSILIFFATPWPLIFILSRYQDQRYELKRLEDRLRSGEAIPMPAGGVLAVPPLPHPDVS